MMEGAIEFATAADMRQYYAGVGARVRTAPKRPSLRALALPRPAAPTAVLVALVADPTGSFIPAFLSRLSGFGPMRPERLERYLISPTLFRRKIGRDWLVVDPTIQGQPKAPSPSLAWRAIVADVARKHKVYVSDVISPRRSAEVVRARHECFWRLRNETTMSLSRIGQRLGGKDHATVIYGIAKHQARVDRGEV